MKSVELLVEEAVKAAIENDLERAKSWLRQIDFVSLDAERTKAREFVWGKASTVTRSIRPAQKTARAPVRSADMFATFQRDKFICRYKHCQRQTIYLPVLKELSRLFPDVLPYQKNWFPVQRHIVYWMWGTSLEHRISFPFGGTSELNNLLTACYQCNDLKNYHQLESLGWSVTESAASTWDGLSSYLGRLTQIEGPARSRSPSPRPTMTPEPPRADLGQLKVGNLIRAQLPGKRQARSYRVDSLTDSTISLSEMWRRESDRTWVSSRNEQTFGRDQLDCRGILRDAAPRAGSIDS